MEELPDDQQSTSNHVRMNDAGKLRKSWPVHAIQASQLYNPSSFCALQGYGSSRP